MKLLLLLLFCLSLSHALSYPNLKLGEVTQANRLTPATSIPPIHPDDNWMFGSLAGPLPQLYNPPITTSYEEMLSNPEKRMISMGVNNSGVIDLNKTVVIDAAPKYVFEDDGIQGTLAPVHKPMKKLPITEQYEEMLKDREKKLVSLGVNSSAFYDPSNQVIIEGTEEVTPLNVMGKSLSEIAQENLNTKKRMARFLEDSPRFVEHNNEKVNESSVHNFIVDKYNKMMKFLQIFKSKENHTTEENKLLGKIKNYAKMIQKMSYLEKFPNDKSFVDSLTSELGEISDQASAPGLSSTDSQLSYRFNNQPSINPAESSNSPDFSQTEAEDQYTPAHKLPKANSLEKLTNEINREISKDLKPQKKDQPNKAKRKHSNENHKKPKAATSTNEAVQSPNELSSDFEFTKNQETQEIATIANLIKNGERDQESASKRLSVLKSLLRNKKNKEISKKEVIFSELRDRIQKINEDLTKKEEGNLEYDLKEMRSFVGKRKMDSQFKSKFKEMITNLLNKNIDADFESFAKSINEMSQMTEKKRLKVDNKGFRYAEVAKKLENTEDDVENGKLYEAEENLAEINDLLTVKNDTRE